MIATTAVTVIVTAAAECEGKMGFENNRRTVSNIGLTARTVLSGNDYKRAAPGELKSGRYTLFGENGDSFCITDEMLSMGLLLVGSTGCGKTTMLKKLLDQVIPSMTGEDVMIIFDSKRDFFEKYYVPGNPKHIVVSLNQKDKNIASPWNIYREFVDDNGFLTAEEININTGEIAKALSKGMENEMQPFFSLASSDFAAKIMASTVRRAISSRDMSELNNLSLNRLLSSDNKELIGRTAEYPEYAYLRSYVGDGKTPQSLGVYGHMMAIKERTFVGSFNKNDPERDFGIREFIRSKGGKILFLEYDVRYKETLEVIYSLLVDLAIKEAVSTKGGNKWFICDEAALLPYLENIGELLNFGRSSGCKSIFALQSYAQLEVNYDEQKAAAVAAGFCNMIAFQNTDFKTRKYVKDRCGEVFEVYDYGGHPLTHDSFTIRDSELRNLKTGDAFVDIKNSTPFRFHFSK